jgi:hypothetical protein
MTDEAQQRDRVDEVARTFLGTPFHDTAEVKGAGVDCATLLKMVYVEAGVLAPFELGHYSPQFYQHSSEERYLGWVLRYAHEIPRERAQVGDIVLFRIGLCFAHGALVIKPGWPNIIHAHSPSRCVRRANGTAIHLGQPILDVKFFSHW